MCAPSMDLSKMVELVCGEMEDPETAPNFGLVEKDNERLAAMSIRGHHQLAGHECRPHFFPADRRFKMTKVG